MKSDLCLGCHTYFEEGQTVPLQSMFIEFKNYFLPIKESKPKWILLKTLVGFLNAKGGTIYIGIQDNQGKVLGQQIKRKHQDEFQLFIKGLADKISPAVDFVNKEEIKIAFVPVVNNKVFKGKFVIKVIVKQGDPSKTYHFSQTIELQFKGKVDRYDIPHAFYRHNMGGIAQIRGEALLEQIARKVTTPNEIAATFHKFCNPQPLKLGGPLTKIGFSGIRKEELRKKLQEVFHSNFQSFDVDYQLTYDIENQVLLIQLQNKQQFQKINKYVQQNLIKLNQGGIFNFVEKGQYLDFYLYKNIFGKRQLTPAESKEKSSEPAASKQRKQKFKKENQQQKEPAEKPKKQNIKEQEKQLPALQPEQKKQPSNKSLSVPQTKLQQNMVKQIGINDSNKKSPQYKDQEIQKKQKEITEKYLQKQFLLTITHLNPEKRDQLQKYLRQIIDSKYPSTFEKYNRTIQLKFESRQHVVKAHQILVKNNQKLSKFGQNNNLVMGINMKSIRISNYNAVMKKQLKQFIQSKLKKEYQQLQFKKWNNKFFLECRFKTNQSACRWLDELVNDSNLNQFNIPQTQAFKPGKVRVYIYCICN